MWRLWLLTGQTLGFMAVVTPVLWANSPTGIGLPGVVVVALIMASVFHFLALEVFTYPEANRSVVAAYARSVGGWRYARGGFLFGVGGAAAGCLAVWGCGGQLRYAWLAMLCPVLALVAAVSWASWVPAGPTRPSDSAPAADPRRTSTSGLPRFPGDA